MTSARKLDWISVEEYLAMEETSELRHEYVCGEIYAMAGGPRSHSAISGNIFAALHGALRGKPCQAYIADMLVRLGKDRDTRMYYPDVFVVCDHEQESEV
jgi:Uma2 family endonuclease